MLLETLLEHGSEESLEPPEEAAVLGLIRLVRWRGLHHGIEMNLARRRILRRQIFGYLYGSGRRAGCTFARGGKYKRRIDLHMNVVRLRGRQRRGLRPIREARG